MKLKILMVNDDVKRAALIEGALRQASYDISSHLKTSDDLLEKVESDNPDAIVIDIEIPKQEYLDQIKAVNEKFPKPVVMFAESSGGSDTIETVVKAGVHAYIVDGLEGKRVQAIVETAVIRFKEYQSLRKELIETKATLEERKKIERAKGLLMEKHNMKEQEAFQTLRKMAMDQNKKMGDVAENIIAMFKFIK